MGTNFFLVLTVASKSYLTLFIQALGYVYVLPYVEVKNGKSVIVYAVLSGPVLRILLYLLFQALNPLDIGVATGEMCQNRVMFKQFLQAKAMQYCQIDACRLGGVNEVLSVILMAAKFNGKSSLRYHLLHAQTLEFVKAI